MPAEQVRRGQFPGDGPPDRSFRCSFCFKQIGQSSDGVAGPGVAICRDCVSLCVEILDEIGRDSDREPPAQ